MLFPIIASAVSIAVFITFVHILEPNGIYNYFFGKKFNPATDIPDLHGKVILVTGGNTGLGYETILHLASRNPKEIFMAARDPGKAAAAIKKIQAVHPSVKITQLPLDLTSIPSIKTAAADFTARSQRLDILINNAGVMALPYSQTSSGHEIQLGTNHLGHAALTKLLLPTLLRTAEESSSDVRIINLSSIGQFFSYMIPFSKGLVLDAKTAKDIPTFARYGGAKLANLLHARGLKQRYPQITAVACHPGIIDTGLWTAFRRIYDTIPGSRIVVEAVLGLFFETPETGSWNTVWCATAPREVVRKGYYYTPVGVSCQGCFFARDQGNVDRLWRWTERELERVGV